MSKRKICDRCERPQTVCLCSALVTLEADIQLTIWQDPDESRHRLSTAPLLQKSIRGSRLLVGDQFEPQALLGEHWRTDTLLLFPLENKPALDPAQLVNPDGSVGFSNLLVLDGTWRKVRRLLLLNPWLTELQHIQLNPAQQSRYAPVRKSPREDGVSTLEASVAALNMLHPTRDFSAVTGVLDRMVELQIQQRQQAQQ